MEPPEQWLPNDIQETRDRVDRVASAWNQPAGRALSLAVTDLAPSFGTLSKLIRASPAIPHWRRAHILADKRRSEERGM